MVFQVLPICFGLFRMAFPHQTQGITAVVSLYNFTTFVYGRRTGVSGNTRCDFFRTNVSGDFPCRQYARFVISFLGLRFINKMQRITHTLDMARLQQRCVNHGHMTGSQHIIAELHVHLFTLYGLQWFLPVNLMAVHTSVPPCAGILRCIIHHVGNSVKGFTLDAFGFLTLCTQLFFFRFA